MPAPFFQRLQAYYLDVAKVIRGESDAASIFPNPTDVGMAREKVYAEFLKQHLPSKCNVIFGGYIFDEDGCESRQIDILITTDTVQNFDLYNQDGNGKSFSAIEGTLGIVSVKSMLNKSDLIDALEGIASIPPTRSLSDRVNPQLNIPDYEDWPLKVVFANDGVSHTTLKKHLDDFYAANPNIPICRRPDFIHVAGKYLFVRSKEHMILEPAKGGSPLKVAKGLYFHIDNEPDLQGIVWILDTLQSYAVASSHIIYNYSGMKNKILTPDKT